MQQKKGNFPRVFVFLLVVIGLSAGCRWFIFCGPSSTSPVDPALLLIEASDLPPGWTECKRGKHVESPNLTEGAEEMAFVIFCFAESSIRPGQDVYRYSRIRAGLDVYRYCGEGRAAWEWEHNVYIGKDLPGPEEWWQIPEDMERVDIRADQWRVGCTDRWFHDRTLCCFTARYGEYVVNFSATVAVKGQEVITMPELASILEEIDRKMVERNVLVAPR